MNLNDIFSKKGEKGLRTSRYKFYIRLLSVVVLVACLWISTLALSYAKVAVHNNVFTTGTVSLDLNGGKPIIKDGEILFKPGDKFIREFYIENTGTDDLYYKFWFTNINGELDDYIDITIVSDGKVISRGNIGAQTRAASESVDPSLAPGERRAFKMVFHMSEVAKNRIKNKYVEFDFCAGATQVKNNPQRQF